MQHHKIRFWCEDQDDVDEAFFMGKVDPETMEIMTAIIKNYSPCAIASDGDGFYIFKDISEALKNPPEDYPDVAHGG